MVRAKNVAKSKPGGYNLQLDSLGLTVFFKGKGGATLGDLRKLVNEGIAEYRSTPTLIIIHLGTNDMDSSTKVGMYVKHQEAIEVCKELLPYSVIIFSHIIPRRFYNAFTNQTKAHQKQRKVNTTLTRLVLREEWRIITHPYIDPSRPGHFTWDGLHLTNETYSQFLDTCAGAVRHFYADHSANIY